MIIKSTKFLLVCITALILLACGGDEPKNLVNQLPTATIVSSIQVVEKTQALLTVNAADTDGEITNIQWLQTSGPEVVIESHDTAGASFVAPEVLEATMLSFSVVVTDNDNGTKTSAVDIEVVNAPARFVIQQPIDITLNRGVTFNASELEGFEGILDNAQLRWNIYAIENEPDDVEQDFSIDTSFSHVFTENGEYVLHVELITESGENYDVKDKITAKDFDLTENLIVQYSFEDNVLPNVAGLMNQDAVTWGGNGSYSTGKVGKAAYFNGVDAYIDVITPELYSAFYDNTSKSISFWANIEEIINKSNILAAYDYDTDHLPNAMYLYRLRDNGDGTGYTETWKNGTDTKLFTEGLTPNTWNHFVISIDAETNMFSVYLNSKLLQTESLDPSNAQMLRVPLTLGARSVLSFSGEYDNFFKGYIDEFRLYSEAIVPAKVIRIFEIESGEIVSKAPDILLDDAKSAFGGDIFTLNPTITAIQGEIASIEWSSNLSEIIITDSATALPLITLPMVSEVTNAEIMLKVIDTIGAESVDILNLTINSAIPPNVGFVNEPLTVQASQTVEIAVNAVAEAGAEIVSYLWSADGLTFANNTQDSTSFEAPNVSEETDYTISVDVTDSKGLTTTASQITKVLPLGVATLNLSAQIFYPNETVDVTASIAGETVSSVLVNQTVGEAVSVTISQQGFSFIPTMSGSYRFAVTLTDSNNIDVVAELAITVEAALAFDSELVAHYAFDDDLFDSVSGTFNASAHESLTFVSGVKGNAASFDGVATFINLPGKDTAGLPAAIYGDSSKSISFWYQVNDNTVGRQSMLTAEFLTDRDDADSYYVQYLALDKKLRLISEHPSFGKFTLSTSTDDNYPANNTWNHLVISMDKENKIVKLYENGQLADFTNVESSDFSLRNNTLTFGAYDFDPFGPVNLLNGLIDEAKFYQVSLNASEVSKLYSFDSGAAGPLALPFVNAGENLSALKLTTVNLSSIAQAYDEATIVSYAWSQIIVADEPTIVITGDDQPDASFSAPEVAINTDLTFAITVTDSNENSFTDHVIVTILSESVVELALVAQFSFSGDVTDSKGNIVADTANSNYIMNKDRELFFGNGNYFTVTTPAATDPASQLIYADASKTLSIWFYSTDFLSAEEHIMSTDSYSLLRQKKKESKGVDNIVSNAPGFSTILYSQPEDAGTWPVSGAWRHYAVSMDKEAGLVHIYLDNVLVNSTELTDASIESVPLILGAQPFSGEFYNNVKGALDEFRVYSKALTAQEVSEVYNSGR
jgi:hypothetical protein